MSENTRYVTPAVRKAAASLGVDLAKVRGTGRDGRIRKDDVRAAAGIFTGQPVARSYSVPSPGNPVAAAARTQDPKGYARAAASGTPEPKLFSTGDLPAFTASGVDVSVLQQVPWQARPAIAAATTQADAFALVQKYTGPDAADAAAWDFRDVEASLQDRHRAWIMDSLSDEEFHASVMGPVEVHSGDDLGGGFRELRR